ncbi:MAG: hypothetical protein ACJA0H_000802 [Francisellaceae bacterium]|jgi:hypothetical protein
MRKQTSFLIIGKGRMAKHMIAYCQLLNIDFKDWSRPDSQDKLLKLCNESSHIFILITDTDIDKFILDNELHKLKKTLVHFSGASISPYAISAHPLMTFGPETYSLETYRKILFVCEKNREKFENIIPGFPNKYAYIKAKDKAYYHCLGALANNFTTILWQTYFDELEDKFNIKHQDAFPILEQTFKNIKLDYKTALTGPLSRGDQKTLDNHLTVLKNSPLKDIYTGFTKLFESKKGNSIL